MNEYLRGPFVSSKSGSADMAWMDNGRFKGCRRENVEDWRAGGETCLQRGRDAPCLLLRQHAASLSPAWPSSHTPFKLYRRFTAERFLRGARHSHTGSWKFLRLAWSLWISFFPACQSPQPLVK